MDYNVEGIFPVPWKQVRRKFTSLFMKEIIINKTKNDWGLARIVGDLSDG